MKIRLFELARLVALKSDSRFQMGAVLARKSRPISLGVNNMRKTHSRAPTKHNFIHAEFDAIQGLSREQTEGAVIYLYRVTKDGTMADSKPCDVCEGMLRWAGVKRVYFTCSDGSCKEMKL